MYTQAYTTARWNPAPKWSSDTPFSYPANKVNWSLNVSNGAVIVPGFSMGKAGTISMWAKCSSYGPHHYLLDSSNAATFGDFSPDRTLLDINLNSDQEVTWINGHIEGDVISDWADVSSFPSDTWHHVAIVWNSVNTTEAVRVYFDFDVNPVASAKVLTSAASAPDTWYFGRRYQASGEYGLQRWQGLIDEYAFWDTALSADQIQWLSHNSIIGLPEPGSLLLAAIGLIGLLFYAWRRRK